MKNLSLYGKFIIVLVTSSFVVTTFFCDYAEAKNALKLYVWDFGTREETKNTLTKNFTQEFEEALIQKKCCLVLERRRYDRILSQKKNEEAISKIKGISLENQDKLKLLLAEAVVFGEVYDDTDSGEIKITAAVQTFDGVNIASESIRFPRNKRHKAAIREENMQKLAEELCAFLIPPSRQEASQVIIFVEDFIGPEQPQPEVAQAFVNNLTTVAAPYSNVRVRKLGRSIPKSKTITLNDPNYIGIVIGGSYKQTSRGGILYMHLRFANLPKFIPAFIQNFRFSFQPSNSSDIHYFSRFIVGVSRLVVKDWDQSIIQFSRSLEQLSKSVSQDIKSIIYALRGMAYIRQGKVDHAHGDFKQAKKINPGIPVPLPEDDGFLQWVLTYKWMLIFISITCVAIVVVSLKLYRIIRSIIIRRISMRGILILPFSMVYFVLSWFFRKILGRPPPGRTLPLALGIETFGGFFTKILEEGSRIPQSHAGIFTTVEDNQTFVEIHILQGLRRLASNNRTAGKFYLEGIPPAPRGVPQIEVVFNIDSNGLLQAQATDLSTGNRVMEEVSPLAEIDNATIKRLQREAAKAFRAGEERPKQVSENYFY